MLANDEKKRTMNVRLINLMNLIPIISTYSDLSTTLIEVYRYPVNIRRHRRILRDRK
jgi:hypothetical protein